MKIGVFTAICVLVSNAVGSGVFTTTGFMARDLGDPGLILGLWAAGGALALAGALSYGELGAALPRSGGEYVYLSRAYGACVGWLSGWTSLTLGFGAAIAAAAMAFSAFAAELLPSLRGADPRPVALALVWSLTALHAWGNAVGGALQRVLTWLKVGGIAALFGTAAWVAETSGVAAGSLAPAPRGAGPGTIAVSMVFVLYAFSGWNAASYIAAELHDPARTLPRALVAGTLFVCALYLLLNVVYLRALPIEVLAAEPVLPIAEKTITALLGPAAGGALSALLCLSIAGAASAMVWVGPRVLREMAADARWPGGLAGTTSRGAPARALLLQAVWVTLLVTSGSFEALVIYSGVPLAVWSGLTALALVVLRVREPELPRPSKVPLYPWLPLLYAGSAFGIAAWSVAERPTEALLSLATIALGLPLRRLHR